MAFCNSCGSEMQATTQTCPGCGNISGLIGGIRPMAAPETPPPTAGRTRVLYFGRLIAVLKIVGGSALALMLVFHSSWIASLSRPHLEASAVISLVIGYGLLKRRMWGLYLLTAAVFLPILEIVMEGERHAPVLPFSSVGVLDLIGVFYFWAHRKDLEE